LVAVFAAAFGLMVRTSAAQGGEAKKPAASTAFAGTFEKGAVAADHGLASQAGAEILSKGGNAVDAAVATSFALSVVRPFSCGIGGGGFMVIALPEHPKQKGKKDVRVALNYREMAPASASATMFERLEAIDPEASVIGGRAAAVPGTVAGLLKALDDYGTLGREVVMAPAIRLAKEGFAVDQAYFDAAATTSKKFAKDPARKQRLSFVWQRFLAEGHLAVGDIVKNPEQAAALELIAKDGAKAFYAGPIAEAIAKACADDAAAVDGVVAAGNGPGAKVAVGKSVGTMTAADLKSFKVAQGEVLKFEFAQRTFLTMPMPSSGGVVMAQTLGFMEAVGYGAAVEACEKGPAGSGRLPSPQYVHLLTEGFKHSFADRANLHSDATSGGVVAKITSKEYLKERAAMFNPTNTSGPARYGDPTVNPFRDGGTSHVCVIDAKGGAVACTETINLEFGSLLAVPEYGFCLNNEMDDFTTHAGKPNAFGLVQSAKNAPEKGRRPLSSMSPTIVLDKAGKVELVAGASGGPRIITATTQVILNVLLLQCSPAEAVSRARVHHQWMPNVLEIEAEFPGERNGLATPMWLRKLHHEVRTADKHAAVQLIVRDGAGKLYAVCDPRKGGEPAGPGAGGAK